MFAEKNSEHIIAHIRIVFKIRELKILTILLIRRMCRSNVGEHVMGFELQEHALLPVRAYTCENVLSTIHSLFIFINYF